MKTLTTRKQLRNAKHVPGLNFLCHACKQIKPVQTDGGTGYGYPPTGEPDADKPVCYACCGERDRAKMIADGKATLYLSKSKDGTQHGNFPFNQQPSSPVWTVSNWPGTLKMSAYVRQGSHNFTGKRYDAWFTGPDQKQWHGVTYGDNTQICHCKRLRS